MTRARRFHEQLTRIAYKPGWDFDIVDALPFEDTLSLRIQFPIDLGGEMFHTLVGRVIPSGLEPGQFSEWLWGIVLEVETHEAGDWFTVDGSRPHDPHIQRLISNSRR